METVGTEEQVGEQIDLERRTLDAIGRELEAQAHAARSRLAQILLTVPSSPAEVQEREVLADHLLRRGAALEAAGDCPCFGRIDRADGLALHIGRIGLPDPDGEVPLLVDWRAEAARPFYAATPADPLGLRRRRHLRLEGGCVVGLADEILDGTEPTEADVPGDAPLARALAGPRTGHMRTAVTTLQAEQDAVVRSTNRGITVVTGGPGTGKTVVALHRAAYLLYTHPRLAAAGVLVIGPDRRFLDYVSQVLPSLGENDVVLSTRSDLLGARRLAERTGGKAGRLAQEAGDGGLLARETDEGGLARETEDMARLKGRAVLADALARRARELRPAPRALTLPVGSPPVCLSADAVAEARAAGEALPHAAARLVFRDLVLSEATDALERQVVEQLAALDAEVAALTGVDLDAAVAGDLQSLGMAGEEAGAEDLFDWEAVRESLEDDPRLDAALDRLWPAVTPAELVSGLLTDAAALDRCLPEYSEAERRDLLRPADAPWTEADLPLLDEAHALLDGPPDRTFGHVVVDEAQDVTDMEWRAIARRCPTRSMTVVGDFAQAGPTCLHTGWAGALRPLATVPVEVHTLGVNYRTTAEILEATTDLLARIAPDQRRSISLRHGETPVYHRVAAEELVPEARRRADALSEGHPGESVAVVCAEARAAHLAAVVATLPAVDGAAGVEVVPVTGVRGLEFDSVVVVAPSEIVAGRSSGLRDLYVALTRAAQRVVVLEVESARG